MYQNKKQVGCGKSLIYHIKTTGNVLSSQEYAKLVVLQEILTPTTNSNNPYLPPPL